MYTNFLVLALAASPLVSAHGKVAVITGDKGGNTTALAIKGAIVPGPGPNSKTEVDTTVFKKTNIQSDGLGRTTGSGKNKVEMLSGAMALSGDTLPQVSPGGSLSGVFHIVTTDGAGPISAVVDTTATGKFSEGKLLETTTQVPGNKGNIKAPKKNKTARDLLEGALESVGLVKRAAKNVNQDFPVAFTVPAGTTCTGTINGIQNVCLAKIANANKAGPFGGVVAFQMVGANATAPPAKRAVEFAA